MEKVTSLGSIASASSSGEMVEEMLVAVQKGKVEEVRVAAVWKGGTGVSQLTLL